MKKKLFVVIATVVMLALTVSAVSAEETVKTRDTVLVLDASGSMSGTPMSEMKEAAKIFCSDILAASGKNRVAIVVYANNVGKTLTFTSDQDSLNSTIDSISADGRTNIGAGIDSANSMLNSSAADIKNIVLLTDGLPNVGSYRPLGKYSSDISSYNYIYANYVYERCSEFKQSNNIYTLGFFHSSSEEELDFGRRFLMDIQNNGYYEVTNASDLKFVFDVLAEDITEENYPIIVVPGMMGSELYDSKDGKVWVSGHGLDRLDNSNNLYTPDNGINLTASGSKREYGAKDYFQELVDGLCEQFPNRAIYFFSYDWRKSNDNSADKLNDLINEVKTQTGYSKVDLVCHSMGGLVASSYVNKYGTNDTRYIITLATPYEGSPDIISRTLNQKALGTNGWLNYGVGVYFSAVGLTKEIMAGLPSSPQLAPTERYFKSTNFLKRGEVKYNTDAIAPEIITSELITEDIKYEEYCNIMTSMFGKKNCDLALAFQGSSKDALLNLDNTYFAIGTGEKTVDSVVINKETSLEELKTIKLTYDNGDGTVPYKSATMTGLLPSKYKGIKDPAGNSRYREFKTGHSDILFHDGTLLWVKNILSQTSNPYEESDEINYSGYTVIRIACPIDVTIDVNGEILSSDPESGSTYVSSGRLDFVGDDGVSICLDDTGTAYDINIVGTGEGTMDYEISWYDVDNTLTETRSFEAVPITKDTVITTTSDNIEPTILNIDSNGDGVVDNQWSVNASGKIVVANLNQGTSSITNSTPYNALKPDNLPPTEGKKVYEEITKLVCKFVSKETNPICKETKSVNTDTKKISEKIKAVCKEINPVCNYTKEVNENSTQLNKEAKGVCRDVKQVSKEVKLVCTDTKEVNEITENVSEISENLSENTRSASEDTRSASEDTETVSEDIEEVSEDTGTVSEDTETASEDTETVTEDTETASEDTETVTEDTETASEDTETVSEDTETVSEDTGTVSEDTETVSEDTGTVSEDTETVSEDTGTVSEDTEVTSEDTETVSEDTGTVENTETASEDAEIVSEDTGMVEDTETVSEES